MTRSQVRTAEAWRGYDSAVLSIALLGLLALLLLAWMGDGPNKAGCCAPIAVTPMVAQPTMAAPASTAIPVPEPARSKEATETPIPALAKTEKPTTGVATTAVPGADCSKRMDGVSVHFAFASAMLTRESRATLDRALECLKEGHYQIAGHADNVGNSAVNQMLSEERAKAVFEYLRSMGIDADRLSTIGFGDTRPIADNATAKGRARNRRVAFTHAA